MIQKPHQLANKSYENYMTTFAEVYEHSPWIIEESYQRVKENAMYDDFEKFHTLLATIVLKADVKNQESLILAHPMLAGKKAQHNELTDFSTEEQRSAGLDNCTEEEITLFEKLNTEYFERFNFPYILAVKGRNKKEILENFRSRIENSSAIEKKESLSQINQIGLIRIKGIYGK